MPPTRWAASGMPFRLGSAIHVTPYRPAHFRDTSLSHTVRQLVGIALGECSSRHAGLLGGEKRATRTGELPAIPIDRQSLKAGIRLRCVETGLPRCHGVLAPRVIRLYESPPKDGTVRPTRSHCAHDMRGVEHRGQVPAVYNPLSYSSAEAVLCRFGTAVTSRARRALRRLLAPSIDRLLAANSSGADLVRLELGPSPVRRGWRQV